MGFEWLSEILFYLLWAGFGFGGLVALKAGLACATGFVLDSHLRRTGSSETLRAASLVLFAWLTQKRWMVQPEIFSALFLAVLLAALEGPAPFSPRKLAVHAGLFCLWANLHGGFVYGLVLYGIYLTPAQRISLPGKLACFSAILAATLVNPYGWRIYSVPAFMLMELPRLRKENVEWMSPILTEGHGLALFYILPLAGLAAAGLLLRRGREVPMSAVAGLGLFGAWATLSYRNIAVSAILVVPWTVRLVHDLLRSPSRPSRRAGRAEVLAAAALAAGWVGLVWDARRLGSPLEFIRWPSYPVGLVEAVRQEPKAGGLYLPFHWAGYASWVLYPERRVFAYGRLDVFHDRFREARRARENPGLWRAFLDRYGIQAALEEHPKSLLPGTLSDRAGRPETFVRRSPHSVYLPRTRWALVHWDDQGLLFLRRDPRSPPRKEYTLLEPGELEYLTALRQRGWLNRNLLRRELRRHQEEAGPSRYDLAFEALL